MTLTVKLVCDGERHGQQCIGARSHNVIDAQPISVLAELRAASHRGWRTDGVRDYCPTCVADGQADL